MGSHLIDGEFQSDKYPTTPRGKVPLSVKDRSAQDLLWEYAQRRRAVDPEFSADLETALRAKGYVPLAERTVDPQPSNTARIYIASRAVHGPRWVGLRAEGHSICSTWIDEAHNGATVDWQDLWDRCVREAATATALILYAEPGETLKGALVELGAALANDVPIFYVGPPDLLSALRHRQVHRVLTMEQALRLAAATTRRRACPSCGSMQWHTSWVSGSKDVVCDRCPKRGTYNVVGAASWLVRALRAGGSAEVQAAREALRLLVGE